MKRKSITKNSNNKYRCIGICTLNFGEILQDYTNSEYETDTLFGK